MQQQAGTEGAGERGKRDPRDGGGGWSALTLFPSFSHPLAANHLHGFRQLIFTYLVGASVGPGRARLLGFRVGFAGQNPSLGTLRLSGFGPFRASGFSGLFQAFLVYIQHIVSFLGQMLFNSIDTEFSEILLLIVLVDK